ncbi:MAG: hypothetical protein QOC81_2930 [Thermoanaerobaculia bacterium]|jgi:hypothetical protein|nr:hypothetical protein [Thermoanaerobaculia bacterium]
MEKEIAQLTTWRNVMGIVALALGLSGPWAYNVLHAAIGISNQLRDAQGKIGRLQEDLARVDSQRRETLQALATTDDQLRNRAIAILRDESTKIAKDATKALSSNVVHFDDEITLSVRPAGPTPYYLGFLPSQYSGGPFAAQGQLSVSKEMQPSSRVRVGRPPDVDDDF